MTRRHSASRGLALRESSAEPRPPRARSIALVSPLVVALVALVALVSSAAHAQEPVQTDSSEEYNRTIERAVERFRERDFERAREMFAAAHALNPSARTLRGLGLTDFEAGRYALAIAELEASLVEPRKPLDPQQRSEVQAVIAHARGFVGTLQIQVTPSEAEVTIDGRVIDGDALLLDAGNYVLKAAAPGFVASEQVVQILPGDVSVAALTLVPERTVTPPPPPVAEYDRTQRTAAWIVGSVGVAGVIVGSVFGVRSIVKHEESDRYCGADGRCDDRRGVTAMNQARAAGDVSTVGFIVGGLALGVATVLLLTAPDEEGYATETARVPALQLGPGTIQLSGRF